jgi:hypothetical protein
MPKDGEPMEGWKGDMRYGALALQAWLFNKKCEHILHKFQSQYRSRSARKLIVAIFL